MFQLPTLKLSTQNPFTTYMAFLSLNVTASAKIFITHVICNVMSPPSLQNFFDFLYLFCDILL